MEVMKKKTNGEKRIENLEKKIKQLRARKAAEESKLKKQAKKDNTSPGRILPPDYSIFNPIDCDWGKKVGSILCYM
jgi:hypothetical protein